MTASETSATRIFISYRRDDAAYPAGWLFDQLRGQFGPAQVFKDVDSIGPGDNFAEKIQDAIKLCSVCFAVIGPRWLKAAGQDGRPRLDDPEDFVRLEIEQALIRGIPVIPILVDGARMPSPGELPDTLHDLTFKSAVELSPERFGSDVARLLSALQLAAPEVSDRPAASAWLSPVSIRTSNDYAGVLRRTWIRAGAPSHDEIERRTGGLVSSQKAADVLGGYDDRHVWTENDFASCLRLLDALGAPEQVVNDWREAGSRTLREAALSGKRKRRAIFRRDLRRASPLILLAIVLCLGTGVAIAYLGTAPGPGAGNWVALVITCLIFVITLLLLATFVLGYVYSEARVFRMLFVSCLVGVALGLLANHMGTMGQTKTMHHIGLDARNWLIWRF